MSSWSSKAQEANEAFEPEVELREVSTNSTLVDNAAPSSLANLPPHIVEQLSGVNSSVDSSFRVYEATRTTLLDAKTNYELAKDSFETARSDYLDRRHTQVELLKTLRDNERDLKVYAALYAHADEMSTQHKERTNRGRDADLIVPYTMVDRIMIWLFLATLAFIVVWLVLGWVWEGGHCRTSLTWTIARNNLFMALVFTVPFFVVNIALASSNVNDHLRKYPYRRWAFALLLTLLTGIYIAFIARFLDGHGRIEISPDCSANPFRCQKDDYSVRRYPGQHGWWEWLEHARSNQTLDEAMRGHIAAYDASEIAQNLTAHYRTLMWNLNY